MSEEFKEIEPSAFARQAAPRVRTARNAIHQIGVHTGRFTHTEAEAVEILESIQEAVNWLKVVLSVQGTKLGC